MYHLYVFVMGIFFDLLRKTELSKLFHNTIEL